VKEGEEEIRVKYKERGKGEKNTSKGAKMERFYGKEWEGEVRMSM